MNLQVLALLCTTAVAVALIVKKHPYIGIALFGIALMSIFCPDLLWLIGSFFLVLYIFS